MAEKIVYFWDYCHKCKHKSVKDYDDPCDECLHNPTNEDSHKPINYEEG
ncbi:MAG: hypothetical protein GX660_25665 [Clostridiaceae bacterium]|nr:hypothetical protein [Clostridiaceae bacterium]